MRVTAGGWALVLSALLTVELYCAKPDSTEAYYDSEGVRKAISIAPDRIGILLRDASALEKVRNHVESQGLKVAFVDERQVLLVATRGGLDRNEAQSLARQIRRNLGPELVAQTGLAIPLLESKPPALIADEVIVGFQSGDAGKVVASIGARILMPNPFVKGQYLIAVDEKDDALAIANQLRQLPEVAYAYPNFYFVVKSAETIHADPLFSSQWHHRNTGAGPLLTPAADARTTYAWDFTLGAATTLISIQEVGPFDEGHEDLGAGLHSNPGEAGGLPGVDDDTNGFIDDLNGWDFEDCLSALPCGAPSVWADSRRPGEHATAVTGLAVARAGNGLGVVGTCPNCSWMPVVIGTAASSDFQHSLLFAYSGAEGAWVINNSWFVEGPVPAPNTIATINRVAVEGRGGLGSVIVFAAGNFASDNCSGITMNPFASLEGVLMVSSSTNRDRKVADHAIGNCVDVLAPSIAAFAGDGAQPIMTTDTPGPAGYNDDLDACSMFAFIPTEGNQAYTNCFAGTSAATPIVAGVAGLALTVNPALTSAQVINLVRDTADKIEDSAGRYAEATGLSAPPSVGRATHAYGRINAFEAVRLVAPAPNGNAGVDIFVRDNRLDWGNTDQPSNTLLEPVRGFIPHWQSVDIKVDAPPLLAAPPSTNAEFESFASENAVASVMNRVYVRVRNRGPMPATDVTVKLHWAFAGTALPPLPADFWSAFPGDSSDVSIWHPLGTQPIGTLSYSGASVATTPGDDAKIASFDFPGPLPVPSSPEPDHFCLLAVIDSAQDHPRAIAGATVFSNRIPDLVTPRDNNVTHRNIRVVSGGAMESEGRTMYMANPFGDIAKTVVTVRAPKGVRVDLGGITVDEPFTLKPFERRLTTVTISKVKNQGAEVDVIQTTTLGNETVTGGMTYRFEAKSK